MFNNVGAVDRLIRLILATILAYFGFIVYGGSALGVVLTIVAALSGISSVAGSCLLYSLLGINTRNPQQN